VLQCKVRYYLSKVRYYLSKVRFQGCIRRGQLSRFARVYKDKKLYSRQNARPVRGKGKNEGAREAISSDLHNVFRMCSPKARLRSLYNADSKPRHCIDCSAPNMWSTYVKHMFSIRGRWGQMARPNKHLIWEGWPFSQNFMLSGKGVEFQKIDNSLSSGASSQFDRSVLKHRCLSQHGWNILRILH